MSNEVRFDVNSDGNVDFADVDVWVRNLANTYFGDANLDGEFNSNDLVQVFALGQYEDEVDANSNWSSGDWNADGEFTTSDLVAAFRDSGYERGPRGGQNAVPEPSSTVSILIAAVGLVGMRRRRVTHSTICRTANRDIGV